MAHFSASSASMRAGTSTGFAKAIARPGYLREVAIEPWMRRLVPVLVAVFLTAVWVGIALLLLNDRRQELAQAVSQLDDISALAAIDLQIDLARAPPGRDEGGLALMAAFMTQGLDKGRTAYLANASGVIVAGLENKHRGQRLEDILGSGQPMTTLADKAGVLRIVTTAGEESFAIVRRIDGFGTLAVLQSVDSALLRWRTRFTSMMFLATAATLVIGALSLAFHQQTSRAHHADFICGEMRRRLETVLSSGRSGLWDWDVARGRIYWSDSMFDLLGLTRSAEFLSFADVQGLLHPGDVNLFSAADALASRSMRSMDSEFRLRHADGHWLWFRARGEMISGQEDRPHLVGIAVDITEEKLASEQRKTSDMRVREAVETLSQAFALFDAQSTLVLANSKYKSLLSLTDELVMPGTPLAQIKEASKHLHVDRDIPETCPETGARAYEMRLEDGRWFHVNERTTRDGGQLMIGSDISAHKDYEASLATKNHALAVTVNDLEKSQAVLQMQALQLAEMAERYLEQKAEAEGANRAKAEFLANMSHELRTPLTHIIGFAELMDNGIYGALGNERYEEYAKNIGESGRYLLNVIGDILDMSSLEAGRIKLERQTVSIAELVDDVAHDLTQTAQSRLVSLDIKCVGPLNVLGDRKGLRQILSNIIGNALKFSKEGGRIAIRARRVADGISLYVEDNGIGMAPEFVDRVGRPFEQSGAVIENGFKGSGLGLAISRSLAELHGGGLRIKSRLGVGTAVMVRIPVNGARSLIPTAQHAETL